MHTKIAHQKTGGQRKERPAPARTGLTERDIPNSAMLSMLSGEGQSDGVPIDELGRRVMSRLPSVQERPQAQIPQAESEADRLSSAVSTGSAETVKAVMGRRLGADFSGVRFHTGAADAARADAMGARAYTSGADVYFGTGGFDAAVAAHELVHTAQQGVVDSSVQTMSTPVGGVQMLGVRDRIKRIATDAMDKVAGGAHTVKDKTGALATDAKNKVVSGAHTVKDKTGALAKGAKDKVVSGARTAAEKTGEFAHAAKEQTWDKTGGRLIRKHHDAMAELHEAKQSGDWNRLTPEEQASWKRHNPLAYNRYKYTATADMDALVDKRKREQDAAAAYLDANAARLGAKSSMLTTEPAPAAPAATASAASTAAAPTTAPPAPRLVIGYKNADKVSYRDPGFSLEDAAEAGAAVADDVGKTSLDLSQSVAETARAAQGASSGVGAAGGALGILTGAGGAVSAARDLREAVAHQHTMGAVESGVDLAGNVSQMGSGAAAIAKAATIGSDAANAAGDAVGGLDIVSGAANAYMGGRDIYKGYRKRNAMDAFLEDGLTGLAGKKRTELENADLLFHDMATQAKLEGDRQIVGGVGKVLTGGADALAGALEVGGVTAGAGLGVKAAGTAAKAGFGIADSRMHHRAKKRVVEQTTGINDEEIRKFQKQNNIKSFSRAKQALMKVKGYGSGQQEEVFADQTAKRGEFLAGTANDTSRTTDRDTLKMRVKAKSLAEGMHTRKDPGGKYEGGRLAKAMGLRRSRGEIAARKNRIKYMLSRHPAPSTP